MQASWDISDKTVVVTGSTAGIGLAAAEELARLGAVVVGVSRSPEKCRRVAEEIQEQTGNSQVSILCADLSSMAQVRRLAQELLERLPRIDVLVNNVGGIFIRRETTVDGFEKTFALNHLAGFLLTNLLVDRMQASAPARIINVSSSAQFRGQIHFDDLHFKRGYGFMRAYGQSKMANMLITYELARRLEGRGVTANALHPGLVKTNIAQDNIWIVRRLQRWILRNARTPEHGAATIVYLAASPEVDGVSGKFFVDEKQVASSKRSYDEEDAKKLWEVSEGMVGLGHRDLQEWPEARLNEFE